MAPSPLLTVSGLTHTKGGCFLRQGLSFQLKAGEAFAFLGPNGSGKTTLLRLLAGIPDMPSGIVKKKSLTQSYVGHLNALKARMTVQQNLTYQVGATLQDLTNLLKEMKLGFLANQQIGSLSAGQRRQVALMRLPLSGATLWLADEPTTYLDSAATMWFWDKLGMHLQKGGAAVLTSHAPIPLPNVNVVSFHG